MKSVGGAGREKGGAEGEVQVRSCCHPGVEPTAPTSWHTQSPWLPCCVWGTLQSPRSPAFPENVAGSAGADHQSRWSPAICCPGCQTARTPRGRQGLSVPLLPALHPGPLAQDLGVWERGHGQQRRMGPVPTMAGRPPRTPVDVLPGGQPLLLPSCSRMPSRVPRMAGTDPCHHSHLWVA